MTERTQTLALELTPEEMAALEALSLDLDMTKSGIMRQALRHYQLLHYRLAAGETMSFSGDRKRSEEFAGRSYLTEGPTT